MKILTRYLMREYLRILFFCFLSVTLLYLLAHFFGRVDEFIEYHAGPVLIGKLILLKIPRIYYEVLPIVILLGTLILLGLLSRNNEMTALRSCGVGLGRVVLPLVSVALVLTFLSLADGEWGVPSANRRINYLDDVALKNRSPLKALRKNRIWFRTGENAFCNILKVDPEARVLHQVTLYTLDDEGQLRTRRDAEQVRWDGSRWVADQGTAWSFGPSGAVLEEAPFSGNFPLHVPLEEMIHVERSPSEMGSRELREYIGSLGKEGYPVTPYLVDLYAKVSYPAINLMMVLLAIPLAVGLNRRGGLALGIGIGLAAGALYWLAYSVGISLGHAALLPPVAAAWLVNVLAGGAGLFWILRIRY